MTGVYFTYPIRTLPETADSRTSARGLYFATYYADYDRPAATESKDEDVNKQNDNPTTRL